MHDEAALTAAFEGAEAAFVLPPPDFDPEQATISLEHARLYADLAQENSDRRKAEEALQASEERWRKLFENSSAGIALVTAGGCFQAANLALQKMLGYTEEELQGLTPLEVTHEEDRAATEVRIAEAAEGQRRDYRIEKRYRRKDGHVIWADVSSTLVPTTGSTPAFFIAVIVDITERKRAEEELRRSEAYLAQGERIGHTGSWAWHVAAGLVYWSKEHFRILGYDPETTKPSYPLFMGRIHPEDRISFEEILNRAVRDKSDYEYDYRIVLPDRSIKFLRSAGQALVNSSGELEFIGSIVDITDLKRAEEMRAAMAGEREMFAQQRATELAKANKALRGCLDALATVPELDEFPGQVMAAITRQLGAVSSTLRMLNLQQNTLTLELLFQDGQSMSPAEAKYPENWRTLSLDEQSVATLLDQRTNAFRILDPHSPIPEALRFHLLGLGIKTLLFIPLTLGSQENGQLSFGFTEERDFDAEELEIARALATQASLAIHLTRLAKTARQSAVLEERNELAGEIHDSLAQLFTGISMQLGAAREVFEAGSGSVQSYVERASDLAQFGLAEARRSAFSLQPTVIEESGLIEALQKIVERSNIPGRLRCSFHSAIGPEESLPPSVQQDLLRIAQEAMSNAVRHARPTVISINLRCNPPDLVLEVTDNGSGIADSQEASREGFGFSNMRARAENIGAQLEVRSAPGRGTTIVVHVPTNL